MAGGRLLALGSKAGRWSFWGRVIALGQLALLAKRHLDRLDTGELGELRTLLARSRGRPANLSDRERRRVGELVSKLEPGAFARAAAGSVVPLRKGR